MSGKGKCFEEKIKQVKIKQDGERLEMGKIQDQLCGEEM